MLNRRFLKGFSLPSLTLAPFSLDYLVIAGGGSGNPGGGGGGAGGYRTSYGTGNISGGNSPVESSLTITPGVSYSVTVGTGGVPMAVTSNNIDLALGGNKGGNSQFSTIESTGGGCGSYYPANNTPPGYLAKNEGGSGGGAVFGTSSGHNIPNTTGISGQGFGGDGGRVSAAQTYSGGGGGAGSAGDSTSTGNGGSGQYSSITGASVGRGGGGSQGPWGAFTRARNAFGGGGGGTNVDAIDNTGGGGGGGGSSTQSQTTLRAGGNGGDGVVILRYTWLATATLSGGLTGTETIDGCERVLEITSGTGTVSFSASILPSYVVPSINTSSLQRNYLPGIYSGSGTTWTASTGADATVVASRFENCSIKSFDISTEGESTITIPGGSALDGTGNDFTLEFWYKFKSAPVTSNYFIYEAGSGWDFFYYGGLGWRLANADLATGYFANNVAVGAGDWNHFTLTQTASSASVYLNGTLVKTASVTSGTRNIGSFDLGTEVSSGSRPNCNVGDIRIYSRDLSAAQVLSNYNASKGNFGL
jgi:hypothetical protein